MRPPLPPKRPKAEPKKTTESLYGPTALWVRLGEIAAENGLSKSELGVWIVSRWVSRYDRAKKKR